VGPSAFPLESEASVKRFTVFALFLSAVGCGDDGSGPDETEVTFPTIDQQVMDEFCVRGTAIPPTSKSGTITVDDCSFGEDDGYYDFYRIRVQSSGEVTFTVSSVFDSWLDLVRIGDPNDPMNTATFLAQDDDSAGDLDAELTYNLLTNTEYWVAVSGFDDSETGTYTLAISQ
jgi:hypothetical protein